jgi:hypothetical protein
MPAKIILLARVCGSHHVAGISGEVQKGVLKNFLRMVTLDELSYSIMDVLIRFV